MSARSRTLLTIALLSIAALCAGLGFWQVQRLRERRASNAAAAAARSAPVVILRGGAPESRLVNRRVEARGRYDHTHDVVLRGRPYMGVPGVEIVSPLILEDRKTAVLVNRGFMPAPDAVTVELDSLREPGILSVQGLALPMDTGGGAPLLRGGVTSWARLDLEALRKVLPYALYPVYIRQAPDSALPRWPRRLDPPVLNDGPHLTYAIQWFAFAVIALVFTGVMARRSSGFPV